jgi:hypothetical protein
MSPGKRLTLGIFILLALAGFILGAEALRARLWKPPEGALLAPGEIPIYLNGIFAASFSPQDLQGQRQTSFVDAEEGKTQDGWPLRNVLLHLLPEEALLPGSTVLVSSSSRGKSMELAWEEIERPENMVLFDLSGRGTLKLVSLLEQLDIRDEWIQDVDRIEVTMP